jgi:GAF domain-containing protein
MGVIARLQDSQFYRAVSYGLPDDLSGLIENQPVELNRSSISGRALLDGRVVQITDIETDAEYTHSGRETRSFRTLIGVPMMREGLPVGVMTLGRRRVQPFTSKQIELVATFADQAGIAIENARLLNELRERTEEVVQLNPQLEQRVADQVGEIERMGRLRRFLPPQGADLIVASGAERQLESPGHVCSLNKRKRSVRLPKTHSWCSRSSTAFGSQMVT